MSARNAVASFSQGSELKGNINIKKRTTETSQISVALFVAVMLMGGGHRAIIGGNSDLKCRPGIDGKSVVSGFRIESGTVDTDFQKEYTNSR